MRNSKILNLQQVRVTSGLGIGLVKGKRVVLKLKCRHIISGQIRLICNEEGGLEVHCLRKVPVVIPTENPTHHVGIDKGYTEAFYTSDGVEIAAGLGKLMTAKTLRITRTNRNRYRLRAYAANHPEKADIILKNNLGYKVKSRRLQCEKATIKNFIRRDLRRVITTPSVIFALKGWNSGNLRSPCGETRQSGF